MLSSVGGGSLTTSRVSTPIKFPALDEFASPLDRQVTQGINRSAGIDSLTIDRLAVARQADLGLFSPPAPPSLNTQLNGTILPVTREQTDATELRYLVNKPTLTLAERSRIDTLNAQNTTILDRINITIDVAGAFVGGPGPRGTRLNVYEAGPQAFTARTNVPAGVTIRNAQLAGQPHPVTGVPFNKQGFPDFSSIAIKTVRIEQTGNRRADETAANRAARLPATPEGFIWHHHQSGRTMQLVPADTHRATGHTGGVAIKRAGGP